MQELGINLEDQDSSIETKDINTDNSISENEKEIKLSTEESLENKNKVEDEEEDTDDSIESIPFISEPVKKKRTKSTK